MNKKPRRDGNCRGIALLLTLGILLLLTLLALGFSSSQLTESQAARNFYYAAKAEEIALGGLEAAIAVLRQDALDNSYDHLRERWAILYPKDDGFAGHDKDDADLSDIDELENGDDPSEDHEPDSRWIEVWMLDPGAEAADPGSKQYRKVGRYAVYIEDENGKVNINIAGNPEPTRGSLSSDDILFRTHRQQMGFTTSEIDLGEIFDGLGHTFSRALSNLSANDYPDNVTIQTAFDVVAFRYGMRVGSARSGSGDYNRVPGTENRDDNKTPQMRALLRQNVNGIDDDGDGMIDEPREEIDEPGEFDPYDPTDVGPPGHFFVTSTVSGGATGVLGNDTPYLTTSHIRMARCILPPPGDQNRIFSISNKVYPALEPYITVYSQDLNRYSKNTEWLAKENIGRWLTEGPGEVRDALRRHPISYAGDPNLINQIALNIFDFIDRDWIPTEEWGLTGIEPTVYLNEVDPTPQIVNATFLGIEGFIEDYGEFIELWNPYNIALDVANYYVTVGSGDKKIGQIAGSSTVPIPPGGFLLIGDTSGIVVNIGQGTRTERTDLPPRPAGCQVSDALSLAASQKMVLRMQLSGRGGGALIEESSLPLQEGSVTVTAQKDDPRVQEWFAAPQTPGALNATLRARRISLQDLQRQNYFYMPGVSQRERDRQGGNFDTGNPNDLAHAGGLSSVGELGMVHRGEHWSSLDFTGKGAYPNDIVLLDRVTLPYQYDWNAPVPVTDQIPARQAVPGRININTAPPELLLGLNWKPMFQELSSSYQVPTGPTLRNRMIDHLLAGVPYKDLAQVAEHMAEFSFGSTSWPEAAREAFMKYNHNLITTKSNIFKVTVLAEAFGRRDEEEVVATRKLEAVIDRGYTPGTSGIPGEPTYSTADITRSETARTLYFRWITED